MIKFDVITVFPELLSSYLEFSILKRARKSKHILVRPIQLRDFANDKHNKVDDTPYGGGAGMVLKAEPIFKAVEFAFRGDKTVKSKRRIILFSTRGKRFDQDTARRLSKYKHITFICGRYEGVDERVAEYIADEEISIGDFVLSGGELPALVVIEAISRYIPGVLGKYESLEEIKGSYKVYTKPAEIVVKKRGMKENKFAVPKVLLSGNHKEIEKWRKSIQHN